MKETVMMSDEFPECCGAMTLSDFPRGWGRYNENETEHQKDMVESWLMNQIEQERGCCAMLLLILAGRQITELGPIVKKLGWEEVFSRVNKNSDKMCTLYARETEEREYDEDEE
jgi:hypothetical protein